MFYECQSKKVSFFTFTKYRKESFSKLRIKHYVLIRAHISPTESEYDYSV